MKRSAIIPRAIGMATSSFLPAGIRQHGVGDPAILPPWKPRGVEVRGRAEALDGPVPLIRIHPERIVSWGIESESPGRRHARTVS